MRRGVVSTYGVELNGKAAPSPTSSPSRWSRDTGAVLMRLSSRDGSKLNNLAENQHERQVASVSNSSID